jgi:hypothetical protein
LGVFTTFCSIMRLVQVKSILATGDQTGLVMWATVEMTVGVRKPRVVSAFLLTISRLL